MYKIGEFANFCGVSVKALRYYNKIGIFKPQHTDPSSGYRYYTEDQVKKLNLILNLKELGFTLNDVAPVLGENPKMEELLEMLYRKQEEIKDNIRREKLRLSNVGEFIHNIEEEYGVKKPSRKRKKCRDFDAETARLVMLDGEGSEVRRTIEEAIWL